MNRQGLKMDYSLFKARLVDILTRQKENPSYTSPLGLPQQQVLFTIFSDVAAVPNWNKTAHNYLRKALEELPEVEKVTDPTSKRVYLKLKKSGGSGSAVCDPRDVGF